MIWTGATAQGASIPDPTMISILEGTFLRGAVEGQGDADEHPQRSISLRAFLLDRTEVTNRHYQAFLKATHHRTPEHCCDPSYNLWTGTEIDARLLDHPVVNVDWHDAQAFCTWTGKRLPTEAEWEKAAKAGDDRSYPWGVQWERTRVNGVAYWAQQDFPTPEAAKSWWGEGGTDVLAQKGIQGTLTLAVDELAEGATPTGLRHLSGNVWEWVADWYAADAYATSPDRDPQGPELGEYKVLRGGSWLNDRHLLRTTARDGSRPAMRNHGTGFRCAKSP
jgi:formylglycine-generating enzyme required for sulfatase activity